MKLFGVWWGATDRRTQKQAQQHFVLEQETTQDNHAKYANADAEILPRGLVRQRRASNLVSCVFLLALFATMVLKPGFTP
jgi:hypothetical protein